MHFKSGRSSSEYVDRSRKPVTSINPGNVIQVYEYVHKDRRRPINNITDGCCLFVIRISAGSPSVWKEHIGWLCEVCPPRSHHWTEKDITSKSVKISVSVWRMTHPSCRGSSQLRRDVSTGTTLKWNISCHDRNDFHAPKDLHPHGKRSHGRAGSESRVAHNLLFSFTSVFRVFIPESKTANQELYFSVLKRLRVDIWRKRVDVWSAKNWIPHDHNAPWHQASCQIQNIITFTHAPIGRFIAVDFHCLLKMKMLLKGHRYKVAVQIQSKSQKVFNSVKKHELRAGSQKGLET